MQPDMDIGLGRRSASPGNRGDIHNAPILNRPAYARDHAEPRALQWLPDDALRPDHPRPPPGARGEVTHNAPILNHPAHARDKVDPHALQWLPMQHDVRPSAPGDRGKATHNAPRPVATHNAPRPVPGASLPALGRYVTSFSGSENGIHEAGGQIMTEAANEMPGEPENSIEHALDRPARRRSSLGGRLKLHLLQFSMAISEHKEPPVAWLCRSVTGRGASVLSTSTPKHTTVTEQVPDRKAMHKAHRARPCQHKNSDQFESSTPCMRVQYV